MSSTTPSPAARTASAAARTASATAPGSAARTASTADRGLDRDEVATLGLPLGPTSLTWRHFGDARGVLLAERAGVLQNMHPVISQTRAREELTAEMAAAMLCTVAGIDAAPLTERHAAYIENWQRAIGEDPKLVVIAAQRAQKACDLILGPDQDQDQDTDAAAPVAAGVAA
jgi:hypothetical protein